MLKTLGLDDDLDPVDVVIENEKVFDIESSASDAEAIFNVGQPACDRPSNKQNNRSSR